jgi:hypothetical protein
MQYLFCEFPNTSGTNFRTLVRTEQQKGMSWTLFPPWIFLSVEETSFQKSLAQKSRAGQNRQMECEDILEPRQDQEYDDL